ncbi:hypothetical protein [Bradyrhizobium sp. 6(2017)]|uniref:hypothetical protein n=1 Tax=Bradyrhizobium sp. 6(2017) TaxID=1197460 RepID=UPI0013E0EB2D|nr:hypothetical protein [Bradyrhizobium sp. 6(2017)]QIG97687.1 hypothetical protein G6P99_38530 [Bradyrhizobium sp. 6(2017)]
MSIAAFAPHSAMVILTTSAGSATAPTQSYVPEFFVIVTIFLEESRCHYPTIHLVELRGALSCRTSEDPEASDTAAEHEDGHLIA